MYIIQEKVMCKILLSIKDTRINYFKYYNIIVLNGKLVNLLPSYWPH